MIETVTGNVPPEICACYIEKIKMNLGGYRLTEFDILAMDELYRTLMEGRIDEDDGAAVFYEASDFFARAAAKSDDATHRRIFERAAYTLFQKELEAFALRVSDP